MYSLLPRFPVEKKSGYEPPARCVGWRRYERRREVSRIRYLGQGQIGELRQAKRGELSRKAKKDRRRAVLLELALFSMPFCDYSSSESSDSSAICGAPDISAGVA